MVLFSFVVARCMEVYGEIIVKYFNGVGGSWWMMVIYLFVWRWNCVRNIQVIGRRLFAVCKEEMNIHYSNKIFMSAW